jgi:hypothetical protein
MDRAQAINLSLYLLAFMGVDPTNLTQREVVKTAGAVEYTYSSCLDENVLHDTSKAAR